METPLPRTPHLLNTEYAPESPHGPLARAAHYHDSMSAGALSSERRCRPFEKDCPPHGDDLAHKDPNEARQDQNSGIPLLQGTDGTPYTTGPALARRQDNGEPLLESPNGLPYSQEPATRRRQDSQPLLEPSNGMPYSPEPASRDIKPDAIASHEDPILSEAPNGEPYTITPRTKRQDQPLLESTGGDPYSTGPAIRGEEGEPLRHPEGCSYHKPLFCI